MADVLPGYSWSKQASRYRSVQTGRFVGRARISELLDTQVTVAEQRLRTLATALHEGSIAPAVWCVVMRDEIRRLHLQQTALAVGGFDRLTQSHYGRIGATLRQEYAKIVGTAQDVQNKTVSLPQLQNRVVGYVGSARTEYHRSLRDVLAEHEEPGTVRIARRILDPQAQHCHSCIEYYDAGWKLIRNLIAPGDLCECGGHCRCRVIYHRVLAGDVHKWLDTRRQVIKRAEGETYQHIGVM